MLPTFGEVGENLIRLWKSTIGDDSSSEILVQEDLCRAVSENQLIQVFNSDT